eukprot:TRINITY_DN2645_c0_g1_i3.p1 TRINITY_DN2645_c0_g1~~TRINITY_DN2645_c0_g1_i3.p1  ORF type:complete len:277 (-),score=17.28 TRINITY_DN2645_c0_g1_i3:250-1080(-)
MGCNISFSELPEDNIQANEDTMKFRKFKIDDLKKVRGQAVLLAWNQSNYLLHSCLQAFFRLNRDNFITDFNVRKAFLKLGVKYSRFEEQTVLIPFLHVMKMDKLPSEEILYDYRKLMSALIFLCQSRSVERAVELFRLFDPYGKNNMDVDEFEQMLKTIFRAVTEYSEMFSLLPVEIVHYHKDKTQDRITKKIEDMSSFFYENSEGLAEKDFITRFLEYEQIISFPIFTSKSLRRLLLPHVFTTLDKLQAICNLDFDSRLNEDLFEQREKERERNK